MSLQKAYHNQPAVSCQLLKLAADVVEAHISFVEVRIEVYLQYHMLCIL